MPTFTLTFLQHPTVPAPAGWTRGEDLAGLARYTRTFDAEENGAAITAAVKSLYGTHATWDYTHKGHVNVWLPTQVNAVRRVDTVDLWAAEA